MKLFEEMPYLEDDCIILKEMTQTDAPALEKIASSRAVYTYLPTFLYEQKYQDKKLAIDRIKQECFLTKESILLGIFLKEDPTQMIGIAEIYAYDEQKNKASIGARLHEDYWYKGIAARVVTLLKDYLDKEIGIRTITTHIMSHNHASERVVEKLGFEKKFPGLWDDWGKEGPVLTDKYVYKKYDHPKNGETV